MKVKDIMKKEVMSVHPDTSVRDAMEQLFKLEISGLPVIDESGRLLGMFTEKDILTSILPTYLDYVGRFVYGENTKGIKSKVANLAKIKVRDIMRSEVITLDEDTSLCEVARIMLTQKIRRAPVINKEGKVIGIVARGDIVRTLTKEQ